MCKDQSGEGQARAAQRIGEWLIGVLAAGPFKGDSEGAAGFAAALLSRVEPTTPATEATGDQAVAEPAEVEAEPAEAEPEAADGLAEPDKTETEPAVVEVKPEAAEAAPDALGPEEDDTDAEPDEAEPGADEAAPHSDEAARSEPAADEDGSEVKPDEAAVPGPDAKVAEPDAPAPNQPPAPAASPDSSELDAQGERMPTALAEAVKAAERVFAPLVAATSRGKPADLKAALAEATSVAAALERERKVHRPFWAVATAALESLQTAINVGNGLLSAEDEATAPPNARPRPRTVSDQVPAAGPRRPGARTDRPGDRARHQGPGSTTRARRGGVEPAKGRPVRYSQEPDAERMERRRRAEQNARTAIGYCRTLARRIRAALHDGENVPDWISELDGLTVPRDATADQLERLAAEARGRADKRLRFVNDLEAQRAEEAAAAEAEREAALRADREAKQAALRAEIEAIRERAQEMLHTGRLPDDVERQVAQVAAGPEREEPGWVARASIYLDLTQIFVQPQDDALTAVAS